MSSPATPDPATRAREDTVRRFRKTFNKWVSGASDPEDLFAALYVDVRGAIAAALAERDAEIAEARRQLEAVRGGLTKISWSTHQHSDTGCSDMCGRCIAEYMLAEYFGARILRPAAGEAPATSSTVGLAGSDAVARDPQGASFPVGEKEA